MNSWLFGGLVGGAVIFGWSVLVALTGIGDVGVKELPSSVVVDCLGFAIEEPGLYPFPYVDVDEASAEEIAAWEEAARSGPRGVVLIEPRGVVRSDGRRAFIHLMSCFLGAMLAAYVLGHVRASYGVRVSVVVVMGLFSWASTSLQYWNWYGFPANFTSAALFQVVGGWFLAGLAIAKIVRGR